MRKLDNKFHLEGEQIIKTSNGEPIPEDEPLFLFRGRDNLALDALDAYLKICIDAGCVEEIDRVRKARQRFEQFYHDHFNLMGDI
jgi:hypothetical protein